MSLISLNQLIEKIVNRIRWKIFFFLRDNSDINKTNSDDISNSGKETFDLRFHKTGFAIIAFTLVIHDQNI